MADAERPEKALGERISKEKAMQARAPTARRAAARGAPVPVEPGAHLERGSDSGRENNPNLGPWSFFLPDLAEIPKLKFLQFLL